MAFGFDLSVATTKATITTTALYNETTTTTSSPEDGVSINFLNIGFIAVVFAIFYTVYYCIKHRKDWNFCDCVLDCGCDCCCRLFSEFECPNVCICLGPQRRRSEIRERYRTNFSRTETAIHSVTVISDSYRPRSVSYTSSISLDVETEAELSNTWAGTGSTRDTNLPPPSYEEVISQPTRHPPSVISNSRVPDTVLDETLPSYDVAISLGNMNVNASGTNDTLPNHEARTDYTLPNYDAAIRLSVTDVQSYSTDV